MRINLADGLRDALGRVIPLVALPRAVSVRHFVGRQVRMALRRFLDPLRIKRYLATHPVRKLQLGTGPNPFAGWLNTDLSPDTYPEHRNKIVFVDAAKAYPLDNETFDYIFSEHQIEHISETDARAMLHESFRVLRPGGRIRIATPDLAAIVGLWDDPLSDPERHYINWVMARFRPNVRSGNRRCYVINHMFTDHKHQFIYDYETLATMLSDIGFIDVTRREVGESDDPVLCGVETHGSAIGDEEVNRFETLVVEATRPSVGPADEQMK
jgi:predicted SAM-dependent methyltransferase